MECIVSFMMKYSSLKSQVKIEMDENNYLSVEGTVEHIVYQNDENGYTVCELASTENELITLVGSMPFLNEGEMISAMGEWVTHANFGRQFKVQAFEKQLPADANAILKYLQSKAIKGIGPTTAVRIVEKFGEETFDIIENHHEWLADIPGISMSKAQQINENYKMQFGIRSVMMFCRDFFGPVTAVKVYKRWGGSAVDVIKQNPYILCDEIHGIGFERADKIARSVGIEKNAVERIRSGIKYILNYNATHNGHVYIPEDKLIEATQDLLKIDRNEAEDALFELVNETQVIIVKIGSRNCAYLSSYFYAEKYIINKLDLLEKVCPKLDDSDIERFITQIESEESIQYASMQRKAIMSALTSGVMILTGGPGTGKTTVIRAVIRVFDRLGYGITLAAPTGRAAKRMSEATQNEAKTIHRMLEMEFSDNSYPRFNRDEKNLLDEEVIIIDETSMVDTMLMSSLLKAIKPGARLILIGDADQLPSVGAGNVLNDLITSERYNTIMLKEIFRQAKQSLIITNAHAINKGRYPDLTIKDNDFFFIPRTEDEDIANTVADLCLNRLPRTYGEKIRNDIQVITPSRKGAAGTEMLNALLQKVLNPPSKKKKEKKVRDIIFREGDKIMQIKNNYNIEWEREDFVGQGIFNGDIGVIESINIKEEHMVLNFDERIAIYEFTLLDELEHAFAITVHKSQGSEYPVVIIPIYWYTPKLLTRNLLYTAVTRAQSMVVMVGQPDVVNKMVDNNRQVNRYTGLEFFMRNPDLLEL